jgi:hypothetical protein
MGPRGVVSRPVAVADSNDQTSNSSDTGNADSAEGSKRRREYANMDSVATVSYATNNMVFILISDIGVEEMTALLLRYGQRGNIPLAVLRSKVKGALDAQWGRLNFNKAITGIAPFLPLEPQHIEQVTELKIRKLSRQYQYRYWLKLHVDPDVVRYLSSASFILYKKHSLVATGVVNVPSGDGASSVPQPPPPASKLFAEFGARSIENSGPLQDLKKYLYRFMQPWRAHQVLHVGLAKLGQLVGQGSSVGGDDAGGMHVYLQWCYVHEMMWTSSSSALDMGGNGSDVGSSVDTGTDAAESAVCHTEEEEYDLDVDELRMDPKISFSPLCETVWHGPFDKFN